MADKLNFNTFLDIDNFLKNSLLNDVNYSTGLLKLNRFVGVMSTKHLKTVFKGMGHNNDVEDFGNDFLAWNIFKINCPSFTIGIDTKEVDSIPRHYFKTWEYSDLEISFIESADMKIRHYFYEWMESAIHPISFARRYYDEVKADWFVIYPLNNSGYAERYELFLDIVPFDINSINFDVSDDGANTVLTTVKFKYIGHRLLTQNFNKGTDLMKTEDKDARFNQPHITR